MCLQAGASFQMAASRLAAEVPGIVKFRPLMANNGRFAVNASVGGGWCDDHNAGIPPFQRPLTDQSSSLLLRHGNREPPESKVVGVRNPLANSQQIERSVEQWAGQEV